MGIRGVEGCAAPAMLANERRPDTPLARGFPVIPETIPVRKRKGRRAIRLEVKGDEI